MMHCIFIPSWLPVEHHAWVKGGARGSSGGNQSCPWCVSQYIALQLTALVMAGMKACSDLTVVTRPWLWVAWVTDRSNQGSLFFPECMDMCTPGWLGSKNVKKCSHFCRFINNLLKSRHIYISGTDVRIDIEWYYCNSIDTLVSVFPVWASVILLPFHERSVSYCFQVPLWLLLMYPHVNRGLAYTGPAAARNGR